MEGLTKALAGFSKLAIIGVGNELRKDDAVGITLTEQLQKVFNNPKVQVMSGGTTPENLTGPLRKWQPSHILLIDAAQLGLSPGDWQLVEADKITGTGFSTHTFSLKELANYLRSTIKAKVLVLGIEPKETGFGEGLSPEVKQTVAELVGWLAAHLA